MVLQPHETSLTPPVEYEVAVGLLLKGGRVLVTRRPKGSHLAGFDEFPGGRRRANETLEQCLRRELLEETGYQVRVLCLIGTKRHFYPDRVVWLWFYLCEPQTVAPVSKGSALDPRWVRLAELKRQRWPSANVRIVEMFQSQQAS